LESIFNMMLESPLKALAFVLLTVVIALLGFIARQLFKRFSSHEERMMKFEGVLKESTNQIEASVSAVQGGLFKIKEDLLTRTSELEKFARDLEHQTIKLSHVFNLNTAKVDLKIGDVTKVREEIEKLNGRVQRVEDKGELKILNAQLGKLAQVLKIHDDKLKGKK
jgi:hypothetical protein